MSGIGVIITRLTWSVGGTWSASVGISFGFVGLLSIRTRTCAILPEQILLEQGGISSDYVFLVVGKKRVKEEGSRLSRDSLKGKKKGTWKHSSPSL
jgi:hypothetical protein